MDLVPLTIAKANELVRRWHRHHKPAQGGLAALGLAEEGIVIAAAILGRPVARMNQDGMTVEITRLVVSNGHQNAASKLYAAVWRLAQALGYRRAITYSLPEESGSSLRGAGWKLIGEAGGGSWSRKNRPRLDSHPLQTKLRWERDSDPPPETELRGED